MVTPGGRAVARSGLLPISADELLGYISDNSVRFIDLIQNCSENEGIECEDFCFLMIHAAYSCSEFGGQAVGGRRFLPYQLLKPPLRGAQQRLAPIMFKSGQYDTINATILAMRWISGDPIRDIERVFSVRSGVLNNMFSDAANILRGISDILYAVTGRQGESMLPAATPLSKREELIYILRAIRQVSARLDVGLHEDSIWLTTVHYPLSNTSRSIPPILSRKHIVSLRGAGFVSPDSILDPGRFSSLMAALGSDPASARLLAQSLQDGVRSWRTVERQRLMDSQARRLPECKSLILKFYRSTGVEFETNLELALECVGIKILEKDQAGKTSFPDFVTESIASRSTAIECKSKTVGDSVNFNDATDVIRKANVNGLSQSFKITVCQPYISPDVPRKLTNCTELCVVNAEDLAEALVRVKLGKISMETFADWIQRPGQALREMLPSDGSSVIGIS